MGALKANRIINEVARFSLYTDKILVFHPLQNPSVTNQEIDPRRNPAKWFTDFVDALYFYLVIKKWVEAGIVKLIINPSEYDLDLRDKIDSLAHKRVFNEHNKARVYELGKEETEKNFAEQFAQYYTSNDENILIKQLSSINQSAFGIEEAKRIAKLIISSREQVNPIHSSFDKKRLGKGAQRMIIPTKGGGPIEAMELIAEVTNSHIYTTSEFSWEIMKGQGINDFWTKTDISFSKFDLSFIDNVETSFALELRREDRLSGLRQDLKKIYSELGKIDSDAITEKLIKDLNDSLFHAFKQSESEWQTIRKKADAAKGYWALGSLASPIILNEVSLMPIVLGSIALLYKNEKTAATNKKNFKIQNPISVFVDLKNYQPSFWSKYKNCML